MKAGFVVDSIMRDKANESEIDRLKQMNKELLDALEGSIKSLERLATEEKRANSAPTGQSPRTQNMDIYNKALSAIKKAKDGR